MKKTKTLSIYEKDHRYLMSLCKKNEAIKNKVKEICEFLRLKKFMKKYRT